MKWLLLQLSERFQMEKYTTTKRAQVMFTFKKLLEAHADELCATITSEHGKVLDDARGELGRGIEVVEYACGISELLKGEFSKNAGPGIDSWSEFQPLVWLQE